MRHVLHRGFTLIELLVAMTIGVLLLLMAMPGMVLWMSDNEIRVGAQSVAEGPRTAQAAATTVSFNPLGQVIANPTNIARVDVTMPAVSGTRPLRVIVGNLSDTTTFYGVKLCDPAFPATDPKGCP